MSNTAPFLHIAYANNDTGTLDFTTTGGIERTYTGFYTDEYATDSSDPTKYKWLTNAEFKNKVNTAAYAKSADGKDDFTTVYPNLNLLNGTKDFSGTWTNSSIWTTDGTYKGLTVKKRTAQYAGIRKDFIAPKDGIYTFSAYIKGSGNTVNISRLGGINSDGNSQAPLTKILGNNFDWTRDSITLNLKANDTAFIRYELSGAGADSIVWTAGHKWEPGSIATPYMQSATEAKDSDYPQYIGLSNITNPATFKDYEWTLLESIPKKILNTHVAYANSSDGVTDFTTVYPNLNLLNFKSGLKLGVHLDWSTGVGLLSVPARAVFDYVSVIPGTTYTINSNWDKTERIAIFAYDSNDMKNATFIYDGSSAKWFSPSTIGRGITQKTTLSIPDGMNFIRVGFFAKDTSVTLTLQDVLNSKIKVEPGSTATPWMPSASEVQPSDYPKFVGAYYDDSTTGSQLPSMYKWSSILTPGPTPPVVNNLYVLTMPTVKSINLTYGIGTLTTKPTSWLSAKPNLDANQVLWYKSEITGTDNSVGVYYSNLVGGTNLDDGDNPLDNTVVSIVLNNKTVNVPRDLALKLELLSQTLGKRDNELAQLIADTNDRITNIDLTTGQEGLIQEIADRKAGDTTLDAKIETTNGNLADLKTNVEAEFTNVEKQLGGFLIQGTKNISMNRPSIIFDYNAYGTTLSDGSTDGGGRLYYQVPGDSTYAMRELKFNYQTVPSFYDLDQITIWENSWSQLYGGFSWRDTIITTTDIDKFYLDGMTSYYDSNGDIVIRGKVTLDGVDDWIGQMNNRGFRPDSVMIIVAKDLKSVKSMRFIGVMGTIIMNIALGFGASSNVQRLSRRISFIGASPKNTLTTVGSWVSLNEKIPYGMRPTNNLEVSTGLLANNNTVCYNFTPTASMRIFQSSNNANQYQVMGHVGWETFDQYPPTNYSSNSAWQNR